MKRLSNNHKRNPSGPLTLVVAVILGSTITSGTALADGKIQDERIRPATPIEITSSCKPPLRPTHTAGPRPSLQWHRCD